MPIHGVDVSRYQGLESLDGQSFVIVNVEDPGLGDKVRRADVLGIPWGLYTWVYPGNGRADMGRAVNAAGRVGFPPPLGFWLDYEQAGVTPGDLDAALDEAARLGVLERTGVYTYLHELRETNVGGHLRGRPLWIAYYPGANDGSYPANQSGDARAWGAVLWQYTSGANAPVGLDRNVVIDEDWYRQWCGAEGDDMDLGQALSLEQARKNAEWTRAYLEGVPGAYPDLATRIKDGIEHPDPANLDAKEVAAGIAAVLGDEFAQKVADELAERLKS